MKEDKTAPKSKPYRNFAMLRPLKSTCRDIAPVCTLYSYYDIINFAVGIIKQTEAPPLRQNNARWESLRARGRWR